MGYGIAAGRCVTVLGIIMVSLYAIALAWALESQSYNVWGSLLIAPIIGAVNIILIWQAGKREEDPWIARLLVVAFTLKMLGSFARYFMVFVLYGGGGDANRYNIYAITQYELWRKGHFVWEPGGKAGTQNLELITTAVYTVIGPSPLAGFLVFASFAFWGCFFIYRAFRIALPTGDHRLYAALLFLLPSLLFWPSSIGKESWLILWLGMGALGVARAFARLPWAWTLITLGAAGTAMIRPHVTVLLVVGVFVAQMLKPVGMHAIGMLHKVLGLGVVAGAILLFTTQSAEFLGIEDLDAGAVADTIEWASGQTAQGGSAFEPIPLENPLGVPAAIGTILFRPFPWEASGLPMLMQSAEGLFLLGLCWWRRASIFQLWKTIVSNPYVAFTVAYSLAFTLAFAGFSNFGILARQRTLMIPFILTILALPVPESQSSKMARDSYMSVHK